MPGNTVSPTSSERGGITTSATPDVARDQRLRVRVEPVLLDQRPRVVAEVGAGSRAALRCGSSRSPKSTTIAIVPGHQRHADERELEEAEAPDAGVARGSETITLTGVPVSASSEPACAPNASGSSSCDGEPAEAHRHHDDDGQQRRDRAVDADQRGQRGDQQHHEDDQPRPALARARDQLLPGPRRHAGGVERLADDEQRGDEEHRRVAEAGERCVEVEHAGRPQRERDAERDERDREAVPDEQRRPPAEHEEGDRAVAHARPAAGRRRTQVCTGEPGPSGIPSRYQTTKNSVQATESMITYGQHQRDDRADAGVPSGSAARRPRSAGSTPSAA